MRGWAFLLSLFLFSSNVIAQCDYRLQHSAPLRASYFDLAAAGDDLWAATGYGIELLDSSVDPPRIVSRVAVAGTTRAIDIRGSVVYAGSGNAVYVIQKNGDDLDILFANDFGAPINDIVVASNLLFVATSNGLFALDPLAPAGVISLATSNANVLSLARNGESEILAADGDATVERFTISGSNVMPGVSLRALDRSIAVSVTGERLFVSDLQQTQIFSTTGTLTGNSPMGVLIASHLADDAFFVAGNDRRFRAVDFRVANQPVELFAADIVPTGGTVNRIGAIVRVENRLYVAGGDAGLITIDVTAFRAPFPLRSFPFTPKTSAVDAGTAVFTGNAAGGLSELVRFSSGSLTTGRDWGGSQIHTVHDAANAFLLTSSGASLSYWATGTSAPPTLVWSVSFQGAIQTAVLLGTRAAVLLADGTVWSADVSSAQPVPVQATVPPAQFLAASDRGVALGQLTEGGTTEIRYYADGNLASAPVTASIAGATTAITLSGTRAAVFTFLGITIADFASNPATVTLLPQSNSEVVRDLAIRGTTLVDTTPSALRVWDLDARQLVRTFRLSSEPLMLSLHPTAAIATIVQGERITTVDYEATTQQPVQLAVSGGNKYPRKAVATDDRLFVFDGQTIDIYGTSQSAAPVHIHAMPAAGAIELAVSSTALYVLFGDGDVTSYTHAGTRLASTTIDEGADMVALGIVAVRNTPWVSISRGCLTTGCEELTIVLEPVSLVPTATLAGGINDIAVSGNIAYALVDLPPDTELRSYSISDPLHPALSNSRPAEESAVAVAADASNVYTLGSRLFVHSLSSLAKLRDELSAVTPAPALDIAIDGTCMLLTGRSVAAELYTRSNRTGLFPLPGTARGIQVQPGRFIVLTDYSIEIWTRGATPRPPRRRAAHIIPE